MLLTRSFAHHRITWIGLAGALVLFTFFALPQGQAAASTLLQFFRGEQVKGFSSSINDLHNAYETIDELEQLGTLQGTIPSTLNKVSGISQANQVIGFSLAEPSSFPNGVSHTAGAVRAIAPSEVVFTFDKTKADRYFKKIGSSQILPSQFNGAQLIVDFPGVAVAEYTGSGGRLWIGEAGELKIDVSGNVTVTQMHDFLLNLPGLSANTRNALQNIQNWQYTIPLGIPTDKVGWQSTSVGGALAGPGVVLNDNSGIASALLWQASSDHHSIGVAGYGVRASQLQSVAGSLH
jgi:hypothetical protein